jgi:hypothetical protein
MITKLTVPPATRLAHCDDRCLFLNRTEDCCNIHADEPRGFPGPECVPGEYVLLPVAKLAALHAEVERQANVLDNCAQEYAEEQIRMASIISDMCNEARELRAEVAALRAEIESVRNACEYYRECARRGE